MRKDLFLILLLITTLALMVVPVSQALMDVLLGLNISISVILLMVAIYLREPSDFSTFPSVILLGTAFRLALSVATTRLILSEADAGTIIETFGDVVVAGSVAIGLVIFLIITAVQFLVVTKGAERVAEVAARFTLDALPGKQMTIDAQVKAGDITAEEGKMMRRRLDKNNQFFGAMDGAMKFVKGDAIAGLIIISVNLIGGIVVGLNLHGLSFVESVQTFSLLTIGDGLVAQIPALLMALSAGVIVTRVIDSDSSDLGNDIGREIVSDPRVSGAAAAIILCVGFIPGFPTLTFMMFSATLLVLTYVLRRHVAAQAAVAAQQAKEDEEGLDLNEQKEETSKPKSSLGISGRIELEMSPKAFDMLNQSQLENLLLDRFWAFFTARGVAFPRPGLLRSEVLSGNKWAILIDEVPIETGELRMGFVAVARRDVRLVKASLDESDYEEFDYRSLSGMWVAEDKLPELQSLGVETIDVEDLLSLLTFRAFEQNIGNLFSAHEMLRLVAAMRATSEQSMGEIEEKIDAVTLQQTVRYLVEDGIPLRPLELVIASLHQRCHTLEEISAPILAECLRSDMKRQLCHRIAGKPGILGLVMISPEIEAEIRHSLNDLRRMPNDPDSMTLLLDAESADFMIQEVRKIDRDLRDEAYQPVIVTAADLRRRLRNFLASNGLHLPVLAPHEVANDIPSIPIMVIGSLAQEQSAQYEDEMYAS